MDERTLTHRAMLENIKPWEMEMQEDKVMGDMTESRQRVNKVLRGQRLHGRREDGPA